MDWERVGELFAEGEPLSASDRDALLASAGSAEADQIRQLWKHADEAGSFLSATLLERAEPAHAQGQLVAGRYLLDRHLGAGGMGEVFSARDGRLERVVALKFIRAELATEPQARARLEREARALCALSHPHICTLYDLAWDGDEPLLVMEYLEGETLDARLRQGPLAMPSLVLTALEILEGLECVHRAGLVHRDLKPANVMLTGQGAKLFDFGIATRRKSAADAAVVTEVGIVIGSVSYMSPEQMSGRAIDARSDIFAVGCLLYEMATGHKAFARESDLATAAAILENEPPDPRRAAPGLPDTLAAAIRRCLRKDPADRYQTAGELLAALRPLAAVHDASRHPARGTAGTAAIDAPAPHAAVHLVGRERERSALHKALADAAAGRPVMLSISGEAGIGKTAMVEEFLEEVQARRLAHAARGRCSERLAGSEAYLPVLEMLESLLVDEPPGGVRRLMANVAPTWFAQLAPARDRRDAGEHTTGQPPATSQERMKRELRGLLDALSRETPLVLFLDDLHWADTSTIDALSYVCGRFETMRVLLLVTYRPTDLLLARHPFASLRLELSSRGLCRDLPLGFLTRKEAERYLDLEYPGHRFPRELAEVVHAKTEGSPLFMVDLVRHLRDCGSIAPAADGWTLASSIPALEQDLPHSVRSMIERKIGQLSDGDRQLLVCAAVQGYTFDSAVVAAALARDAADVEERLEQLDRVYAFIHVLGDEVLPDSRPTLRCRFVHVLYQNAFHASIRATRRAAMSAAVAEALIRFHGADHPAKACELAVLFESAHQPMRAARAFLTAAQNALRVYAYVEAVWSANRGLAQLALLPATNDRDELELQLQVSFGTALVAIGGYTAPEVERAYARARELCRRIGNPHEMASVLFGLFVYYVVVPAHDVCLELAREMLLLAERERSAALRVRGLLMQGMTRFWMGDVEPSVARLGEAIALYDGERHAIRGGTALFDDAVGCRRYQAVALWLAGYPDQALARAREALDDARQTENPLTLAPTLGFAAMLHHFRREVPDAVAASEEAVACAREYGLTNWLAFAGTLHGWAAALATPPGGEPAPASGAVAEIVACLERQSEASARRFRSLGAALLAEAYLRQGALDGAAAALDDGLRMAESTGEGFWEAELHRLRGDVLRQRGDATRAAEQYEAAIALAARRQERSLTLRALTSLFELTRTAPEAANRQEVRARLQQACGWFTEGFQCADLVEAGRLLQEPD